LWYTSDAEDKVRRAGRGKEHRPGPQVQVGLLVDPGGFPLEVHLFPGNKGEVRTILPVLKGYRERTGTEGMVVVADAAMLSADNLDALEGAGFGFIVGSKQTKAADDLAAHFAQHGDYFPDGATVEASRRMGRGKDAKTRRVVWHYSFKRHKRDDHAINKQIERAGKIASGDLEMRNARFLKVDGAEMGLNQALIDRARRLAGLKGYVTSLSVEQMPALEVVGAYHQLYEVERSFRMAKSDLRARPIFHHLEDSIEAHLTTVFAALAVSRHLEAAAGVSIKRLVTTLRQVRSAVIEVGGGSLTVPPAVPPGAQAILDALAANGY
jgi:transposase